MSVLYCRELVFDLLRLHLSSPNTFNIREPLNRYSRISQRTTRIELASRVWQARVIPLYDVRELKSRPLGPVQHDLRYSACLHPFPTVITPLSSCAVVSSTVFIGRDYLESRVSRSDLGPAGIATGSSPRVLSVFTVIVDSVFRIETCEPYEPRSLRSRIPSSVDDPNETNVRGPESHWRRDLLSK